MTKIELKKASRPLSEYAQEARKAPVIVVKGGKPFAAVVPIRNVAPEFRSNVPPPLTNPVLPQSRMPLTAMVAPLFTVTVEVPNDKVAPLLTVKLIVLLTVPPDV